MPPAMVIPPSESPYAPAGILHMPSNCAGVVPSAEPPRAQKAVLS